MSADSPVLLLLVIAILVAAFFTLASCERRGAAQFQRSQSITNHIEAK